MTKSPKRNKKINFTKNIIMRILTVLLVLFTSQLSAQFNTIDGKTFRRLSEFSMPTKNFGVDTVKSISITDTSRASGLLLLSKDTTAMYVYGDTQQMFTTASAWNFTPALPCCVPDTVNINYILTNCPTPSRNELLIVTPNVQATTTACDTLPYLYVDTINYSYNNGLPYYVYTALITQTDTFPPVALVLENTIGTVTFNYLDIGEYSITSSNFTTCDSIFYTITQTEYYADAYFRLKCDAPNTITLQTFEDINSLANNIIQIPTPIEIRVYK
jgi:hypothetical protein